MKVTEVFKAFKDNDIHVSGSIEEAMTKPKGLAVLGFVYEVKIVTI